MLLKAVQFEQIPESIAIFVYENDFSNLEILGESKNLVEKLLEKENFKGKEDGLVKLLLPTKDDAIKVIYVAGLGKKDKVELDNYRRSAALVYKRAKKDKIKEIGIYAGESLDYKKSMAVAEGFVLGSYTFDKYKTKDKEEWEIKSVHIYNADEKGIQIGNILAQAQNFARSIVNEPGNVINPITFAQLAQEVAKEHNLECIVYDENQIQEMGMLALWSVGKGSSTPPRFVHLIYKPSGEPKAKIAIVGKGLTFDSGGLNIKTGDYMRTMKMDKSGACAMLGIMKAIAQLKPNVEVHGISALAENMPSGTAYRPDDIIKALNGKTIEIDNTDAEGRVTLADALSYASRLKPSVIIDLATLTGACIVALGEYTAGLFSNSDDLANRLLEISKETGERLWKLPLDDKKLREKIKKGPADVVNSGGRYGGAITAAMFLEEFVDEGIKWAHLDIAGPAYIKEEFGYYTKEATGFGVRTCVNFILSESS